jgi:hypothetical protein
VVGPETDADDRSPAVPRTLSGAPPYGSDRACYPAYLGGLLQVAVVLPVSLHFQPSEPPWVSWRLQTLETRMELCRRSRCPGSRRRGATACIRPGPFHTGPLRTIADVEYATMAWADWWNNRRLHSTLGMRTPDEHEQAHYAALTREPQPA